VLENCVHPAYKDMMREYITEANARGGHTPHCLEKAFSWHLAAQKYGDMRKAGENLMAAAE